MRTADRVRLVVIMAVAGLNSIMSGVALIGDFIQYGVFQHQSLTKFIYACVIFWLAAEVYGLRCERAQLRRKNAILTDSLEAHNRRIENERS